MKLCTYKETIIMNNFPHHKFQFVIKSRSLHYMLQEYLIIHYVIIMLMIMIFSSDKMFFH